MRRRAPQSLADAIRRGRAAKRWTQLELAGRAKVSESTIWNIENGIYLRPQPAKLYSIAKALNLNYDDLEALAGRRAS